jgi:hypothetical protein
LVLRPAFAEGADPDITKTVDTYMTTRLDMGQFSGAVLVAVGGREARSFDTPVGVRVVNRFHLRRQIGAVV